MSELKVSQFAAELRMPPQELLEQLRAAGVDKRAETDDLSAEDKARLLEHLKKKHGDAGNRNKITLTQKQTTEIRKTDATGKAKAIGAKTPCGGLMQVGRSEPAFRDRHHKGGIGRGAGLSHRRADEAARRSWRRSRSGSG